MHKNDYYDRVLLDTKGGSFGPRSISKDASGELISKPHAWQNYEFIDSMVGMIRDAVAKKTAKAYPPNTVLLVHCYFERIPLLTEWDAVIKAVQETANPMFHLSFRTPLAPR